MAITLNPFRQSPGYCGPASLKILLEYYGKSFSEDELARICGSTQEKGTDHAELVAALETLGEKPVAKERATIEDVRSYIRKGTPVIVGWWSTDEDHYSVVYDMRDETISLMDPEVEGGSVVMPITDFEKVWHDFDGAQNIRVERWMLAIERPAPERP
ncbi:C39 family peptidase [Candidatus Uhrbacteria bacterium]|nr:C39 family peptidase [Candidatus Uhrbacteria bacterium]